MVYSVYCECLRYTFINVCMLLSFLIFECGMRDFVVLVSDHCLSFYFQHVSSTVYFILSVN